MHLAVHGLPERTVQGVGVWCGGVMGVARVVVVVSRGGMKLTGRLCTLGGDTPGLYGSGHNMTFAARVLHGGPICPGCVCV